MKSPLSKTRSSPILSPDIHQVSRHIGTGAAVTIFLAVAALTRAFVCGNLLRMTHAESIHPVLLTRLVEGAVGYDTERGDTVVVDSMPFAVPEAEEDATTSIMSNLPTGQIFTMLELLVVAGVGLAVMRMLRPKGGNNVDGGILAAQGAPLGALSDQQLAAQQLAAQQRVMIDETTGQPLAIEGMPAEALPTALSAPMSGASHMAAIDQEIAMSQVEGGIKASSLRRIGETIVANPSESASVIRQWMNS